MAQNCWLILQKVTTIKLRNETHFYLNKFVNLNETPFGTKNAFIEIGVNN